MSARVSDDCGLLWQTAVYGQSPESNITNQTTDARKSLQSQPKMLENRSKISRKSSPNRSLTVRVTKIAPGRLLARCFGRPNRARAAPRALVGCQKRLESVSGRAKDGQKRGWRAPGQKLEHICLGERCPRRSWINFRTLSRRNSSVFLDRSCADF